MSSINKRKQEIINALTVIARNSSVKVCLEESFKGAIVCGTFSLVGGLLLGPAGLAIGGALGGIVAYNNAEEFLPLHQALRNLTESETDRIIKHVEKAVAHITPHDLLGLLKLLINSPNQLHKMITNRIVDAIIDFLSKVLKYQVVFT